MKTVSRARFGAITLVALFTLLVSLACGVALPDELELGDNSATEIPLTPVPTFTLFPQDAIAEADAEERLFINIYQRVNPAVVNIDVIGNIGGELSQFGSGSGFIVDQEGHIVTNNHVVEDAERLLVTFGDGTVMEAEVLGTDAYSDLAVIQVESLPEGAGVVELGDSDSIQVGQRVLAIGNPFGLSGSMSVGIISGIGRTLPSGTALGVGPGFGNPLIIQTDAAINPGNSGGPLLDSQGQVIGVNVAIRSEIGLNSGVGFAIPVNTVRRIVPQLIERGYVSYPYLGVLAESYTLAELATEFDLPATQGVLIASVLEGEAADQAGLRGGTRQANFFGNEVTLGGDIIVAIDGAPIRTFDELLSYLVMNTEPSQVIVLTIVRGNATLEIPVTLGTRPGR